MFKVTSPPSCARILFLPQGRTHTTLLASRHNKPSVMLFSAEYYSFCQKESMQRNSPLVWYPTAPQQQEHCSYSAVVLAEVGACWRQFQEKICFYHLILAGLGHWSVIKNSFTWRGCELSPWGQQQHLGGKMQGSESRGLGLQHQCKGDWIWCHHAAWLSWQQQWYGEAPEQVSSAAAANTHCRCGAYSSPIESTDPHPPSAFPPLVEVKRCVWKALST